jgi:hypothetical protein
MRPERKISIIPLAGKITMFAFFAYIIFTILQISVLVIRLHEGIDTGYNTGMWQIYQGQTFQFCETLINSLAVTLSIYDSLR